MLGREANGLQKYVVCLGEVVSCNTTWCDRTGSAGVLFAGLQGAGLVVTLAEYEVVEARVQSLSYIVGYGCVTPPEARVEASRRFPAPSCSRVLQRIQGVIVCCWWFVPGHSTMLMPLTDLLQEGRKWEWGESCERASCQPADVLCSSPGLKAPELSPPFVLAVDVSQEGAGDCVS